jgi:hypothetical protein
MAAQPKPVAASGNTDIGQVDEDLNRKYGTARTKVHAIPTKSASLRTQFACTFAFLPQPDNPDKAKTKPLAQSKAWPMPVAPLYPAAKLSGPRIRKAQNNSGKALQFE